MTDHYILFLNYKAIKPTQPHRTTKYRNFKHCNFNALNNELSIKLNDIQRDADRILNFHETNEIVSTFYLILDSCLDNHAPFITKTFKKSYAPWMTADLRIKLNQREKNINHINVIKIPIY